MEVHSRCNGQSLCEEINFALHIISGVAIICASMQGTLTQDLQELTETVRTQDYRLCRAQREPIPDLLQPGPSNANYATK